MGMRRWHTAGLCLLWLIVAVRVTVGRCSILGGSELASHQVSVWRKECTRKYTCADGQSSREDVMAHG